MKGTLVSAWIVSGLLLAGGISVGAIAQETPESLASDVQLISLDPATEAEILSQVDEQVAAEDFEGAIALLEALSAEGSQNPAVYSRLGGLYLDAGRLPEEALQPYAQALDLATATQDLEAIAQAWQGLAEGHWLKGDTDEATRLFNGASLLYEALEDTDSVAEIDERITEMSAEPSDSDGSQPVFRMVPGSSGGQRSMVPDSSGGQGSMVPGSGGGQGSNDNDNSNDDRPRGNGNDRPRGNSNKIPNNDRPK